MSMDEEPHVEEDIEQNELTEAPKIKSTILDNFKGLTKDKEKLRTKAGTTLVRYLLDNGDVETELKYALGRLVRGLGSSTINARCGFYSTLMALLNYSNISVEQVFEHVTKELHKGKSNSKSENADIATGHVLVCGAILRSELFMKSTDEEKTKVLKYLIIAGKERSYLLYASFELLLGLVEKLSEKDFETMVLPLIQPELEKSWAEHNLDTLFLLINLKEKYPKIIGSQILEKINGDPELLNETNLEDIANVLMNIPRISALRHPIYETFGKVILKTEFTIQFMEYLDGMLSKYNKNKHLININFLTLILKNNVSPNDLPLLLQKNLIQQTLTIFRQLKGGGKDNELKQLTHKLFEAIHDTLKKEEVKEKTKILVLKKLLFFPGTFIFEKITKSKLVQQITCTLQSNGVKKLGKLYREVIMLQNEKFNADSSETFQNNDRLYAAHLLVKLLGHPKMHDENIWKGEQLKFLMHLGLTKQPNVGVELASSLKETFYRSLDLKLSKLDDLSNLLLQIFNDLDSLLSEDNIETALRSPVMIETYQTWTKAKHFIMKIEPKKSKKVKLVFQILFLHLGLQLFNDVNLAKDSLEELFSCYKRIKKEKQSDNGNDPSWIDVVVELLLSLLSHNSHLLRKIINCVFPHLCKYLKDTNIHQIISVLDPMNEDNPLSNRNDISDESEQSGEESDNENDDEESDEVVSEEEDIEESNNDKLRKALHIALMQNMDDADGQSDKDLDTLDEEQGEKLNRILGDVFKQYKPNIGKSKKQNRNDETLTHFRVRVLDLIEIYLDSNPSMILTLEIMLPLLHLLDFSIKDNHQKPLQDRVRACLKKLTNIKKFDDISEVNDKILCDLLRSLLEKGTKNTLILQFMSVEIANCCIFIIRCSQNLVNAEETPKKIKKHLKQDICNIINDTLQVYLTKRDCHISFVLFKQVFSMNWIGNVELITSIMKIIFQGGIRPFIRNQSVELMKVFYSNHRFLSNSSEKVKGEITSKTREFLNKNMEFFSDFARSQNTNIKEKFISLLFSLIIAIKHSPVKCEDFNWKKLGEAIREYRSFLSVNQDTRRSFNKLCSTLCVQNVVQMKQSLVKLGNKNDDDNSSVATSVKENKKEKRKKNNEKLKTKKDAKEERLKSLSEGLEVQFSTVENMNGIEEEEAVKENGDSIDKNKLRKRKLRNGEMTKSKKSKT